MLVLSRKCGEKVVIGGNIEVIVTHISGGRVRLGFHAPKRIAIRRSELPIGGNASVLKPR